MTAKELYNLSMKAHADAEEIRSKYNGKPGEMPADELERWEKALSDADLYWKQYQAALKADELDKQLKAATVNIDLVGKTEDPSATTDGEKAWRKSFNAYLFDAVSTKDLSLYQATTGGYIGTPPTFMAELIKTADKARMFRQIARVLPPLTDNVSLGAPSLEADVADPEWTGENTTITLDTALKFGQRELKPALLKFGVKISKHLMGRTVIDPETFVRERLGYKFGLKTENAYLNGTGVNQPLGVFVASANGIPTTQDYTTTGSNAIASDDIIGMFHSLRPPYRANAVWVASDDFYRSVRLIKDSVNQYVWQPFGLPGQFLTGANPGSIMGRPYYTSELCTAFAAGTTAFADNAYAAVFGDFSYYWIADCQAFDILVDPYTAMATMQNIYYGVAWTDGMPVLGEAFARLKVKA